MSQLIGCTCADGVVLAADRRVEVRDEAGDTLRTRIERKAYLLGPKAAVASSGAAMGISVCEQLSRFLAPQAGLGFEEIEGYLLTVFQQRYDAFIAEGAEWFSTHPEALTLAYLALAGLDEAGRPTLRFYGSESHDEPVRRLPQQDVLVAPRRMGLEFRLARARLAGAGVEEVRDLVVQGMEQLMAGDEQVGGGYDVTVVTADGRRIERFDA